MMRFLQEKLTVSLGRKACTRVRPACRRGAEGGCPGGSEKHPPRSCRGRIELGLEAGEARAWIQGEGEQGLCAMQEWPSSPGVEGSQSHFLGKKTSRALGPGGGGPSGWAFPSLGGSPRAWQPLAPRGAGAAGAVGREGLGGEEQQALSRDMGWSHCAQLTPQDSLRPRSQAGRDGCA